MKTLFVFLLSFYSAQAVASDSCIYILPDSVAPDWKYLNRDSIAVDTCNSSSTYNRRYSKRYDVYFKVNAFQHAYGAPDSIMITHWVDIDTIYSALRDSLASIYDTWPFYFQKVNPQDTVYGLVAYKMIFEEYILAKDVLSALGAIWTDGLVEIGFQSPHNPPNYIPNDKAMKVGSTISEIQHPSYDAFWKPFFHKRGWQWHNYSIKTPMAWEITKGRSEVVVGNSEVWQGGLYRAVSDDITKRTSSVTSGNLLVHDKIAASNGDPQFKGDGLATAEYCCDAHLRSTLPLVISKGDNDNITNEKHPLAGVAYNTTGIAFDLFDPEKLDFDHTLNGKKDFMEVYNESYGDKEDNDPNFIPAHEDRLTNALDSGIVITVSAGNNRDRLRYGEYVHAQVKTVTDPDQTVVTEFHPIQGYAAAYVWPDDNEPDLDTRVIAVGAITDGPYQDCSDPNDAIPNTYCNGVEQFDPTNAFSPGKEKFSPLIYPEPRRKQKEKAILAHTIVHGSLFFSMVVMIYPERATTIRA